MTQCVSVLLNNLSLKNFLMVSIYVNGIGLNMNIHTIKVEYKIIIFTENQCMI